MKNNNGSAASTVVRMWRIYPNCVNYLPIAPQIVIPLTVDPDQELIKLAHEIEKIDVQDLATLLANFGRDRVYDVLLLAKDELDRGNKISLLTAYLYKRLLFRLCQVKV